MTDGKDPYLLASLHRGLEVIDCFARRQSWSLAELSSALGQNKATVFRVLHTLEQFGYLTKDPATGHYSLGLRFHALGAAAVRHEQLRWQALPPLQDLAEATGETVHVGILHDGVAVTVQIVEGTHAVRMHSVVGKRSPAHASALGKVLLAFLPDAEVEAAIAAHGLKRFTAATLTTPGALREALHRIRQDGFAQDEEEQEVGLRCIAVPITDHTGRPTAALAISAPASRMDGARVAALVPQVKASASRISRMLGSPTMAAA
ncbi:IclR family transcriptional regulator [Sabulicella rubraurantiaca]|uniref:IclR family transcriptional regulator n=1 Tax=Sabulicella rubraurantiaca TaxID=2811429 RepID=UPI001A96246A|nr:IclR family transcriptional regulator [Sabulicella rubraurantiaca]